MIKKQKQVLVFVIIAIIVVVILALAGYLGYKYFSKPENKSLSQQQIDDLYKVNKQEKDDIKPNFQAVPIAEWKTYKKDDWGVEFKYPATFGNFEMYGDILAFKNKTDWVFFLKKENLDDIKKCEEALAECEKDPDHGGAAMCGGCSDPKAWQEQKNFVESAAVGKFVCDGAKTEAPTDDCESCEIVEEGGIKMEIHRNCWSPGGPFTVKIFFKNDTRFSFLPLYQDYMGDIFGRYGTDEKTILSTFKFTEKIAQKYGFHIWNPFKNFVEIENALKSQNANIPIMLPAELPSNFPLRDYDSDLLFQAGVLQDQSFSAYEVDLDYGTTCAGASRYCEGIEFQGVSNETSESFLSKMPHPEYQEKINLDKDIAGYYSDNQIGGAYPGRPSIKWFYNGNGYSVYTGILSKQEMINLVNSIINNKVK